MISAIDSSAAPDQDWDAWLASHGPRFLLYARQQTRSEADAEDVLQDALVETWQRAGGRPDAALVFATIRRRAIDLGRRTDRRTVREERSADTMEAWYQTDAEDRDTAAVIAREMQRLPADQREVLTLKLWGGLTFAEVATTLDIPPGTAASRYRSAVEALRQSLTPVLT